MIIQVKASKSATNSKNSLDAQLQQYDENHCVCCKNRTSRQ